MEPYLDRFCGVSEAVISHYCDVKPAYDSSGEPNSPTTILKTCLITFQYLE